jgi:ribonuclease R
MLKAHLRGAAADLAAEREAAGWIAEHASGMERVADAAARESQEVKLVEYMARFVGRQMEGVVSYVTPSAVFVRLPNTVEGVIPVRDLGREYFSYDAARYAVTGEDSGLRLRMGQQVRVIVKAAPAHARKLDLRLA